MATAPAATRASLSQSESEDEGATAGAAAANNAAPPITVAAAKVAAINYITAESGSDYDEQAVRASRARKSDTMRMLT